jgi:hypothetical protein
LVVDNSVLYCFLLPSPDVPSSYLSQQAHYDTDREQALSKGGSAQLLRYKLGLSPQEIQKVAFQCSLSKIGPPSGGALSHQETALCFPLSQSWTYIPKAHAMRNELVEELIVDP